mgnify:CR=1 FL=1
MDTPPMRPTLSGPLYATISPMLPSTGIRPDLVSVPWIVVMHIADPLEISGRKFPARHSLPSRLSTAPWWREARSQGKSGFHVRPVTLRLRRSYASYNPSGLDPTFWPTLVVAALAKTPTPCLAVFKPLTRRQDVMTPRSSLAQLVHSRTTKL